jgi:hypothetical protein
MREQLSSHINYQSVITDPVDYQSVKSIRRWPGKMLDERAGKFVGPELLITRHAHGDGFQ